MDGWMDDPLRQSSNV